MLEERIVIPWGTHLIRDAENAPSIVRTLGA